LGNRIQRPEFLIATDQLLPHRLDAEQRLDPRNQLVVVERLGDVVVGPGLEPSTMSRSPAWP